MTAPTASSPPPLAEPPRELAAPRPGAMSALVLLLSINLFNYIDRQILSANEPLMEKEFFKPGDPHAEFWMGALTSAFLVSYMLFSPLFGMLGDRFKRWPLVGIGVILWSLASGGTGLAGTFAVLFVTRMFVGIGEAAYGPTAPTVLADMYPASRRGSVLAWFYMAIPVGSALGYVVGGGLGGHFGWRMAFYAVVPPGLLLGALCFLRPEPARTSGGAKPRVSMADVKRLLGNRSYVLNTLGMAAMTFALGGLAAWMPRYVSVVRGVGGADGLGHVTMIFGAITVVAGLTSTLFGGYLADLLRTRVRGSYFVVSGVGLLVGFPFFLAMLFLPFPMAWVAVFLAVFCLMLNTGPTNAIIANVTPAPLRGTAYAVNILIIHTLGDVPSPPLIGWISGQTGSMNIAFATVGVAFLVGGVLWLMGARGLERDTAAASE